ncbi:MAG: histidine--tRNA ligase [Pyrinomonadaceae bacterium]
MVSTNPARGMRDFLPGDIRKREYVIGVIKQVYESYGFEPLETPAVENIDTLMGKYGDEGNQLIFKILKRGEKLRDARQQTGDKRRETGDARYENEVSGLQSPDSSLSDLALRYDLTVPLARVVANHKNDLPKFFKRYQIQPVWRADRPARGRFREFYQCDVDCIGSESMVVEAEMMSAVSDVLIRLKRDSAEANFDDFVILLNHRDVLFGILDAFEVPKESTGDVLITIDKANKIGWNRVLGELVNRNGLSSAAAAGVVEAILFDSAVIREWDKAETQDEQNGKLLQKLRKIIGHSDTGARGLDAIEEFLQKSNGLPSSKHMRFQPSLARGLSYYTGAIFEIGLNRLDFTGSVGGGGRYDGLIGMFGKEQIPACGFSLGLERILVVMEERGMFPPEIADSAPADVMVTIWSEETIPDSLKLANDLRAAGLRVTLYPEADKIGKQMKYADSIKVPYVCVLGESEIADGTVTLKNMKTGEQQAYPLDEIASKVV